MFKIGDKLTKENYTAGAIWCNHNNAEVKLIDGEYVLVAIPELLPPTKEEQQKARAEAYKTEVDPITCHIQRLEDEPAMTNEINAEIAALKEERKAKVAEIKERYPYPEEPESEPEPESEDPLLAEPDIDSILAK